MAKRFVSIWFRHLKTDWFSIKQPALWGKPFVLAAAEHGRMIITATNSLAQQQGIHRGMAVADARAIIPALEVVDDKPALAGQLLKKLAEWCIRFSPVVATDAPDGLILDATGCAHLWDGESCYIKEIVKRIKNLGYEARAAIADTIGAAWAVVRFRQDGCIVESGRHTGALLALPPAALRLSTDTLEKLQKLGLRQVGKLISIPRPALKRRFGVQLLQRIDQALGCEEEAIEPVLPVEPYHERLPCLEPIVTATGIEIAIKRLLDMLCSRLQRERKGLRTAVLKAYRTDRNIQSVTVGTSRPSYNKEHLFKLFELKLPSIEPALGIELFVLEATKVEDAVLLQEKLWEANCGLENTALSELLDRIENKLGSNHIYRYLQDEHYWPERSVKRALSLTEKPVTEWRTDKPRPLHLLQHPEPIQVAAPIPDYPPMLFRYKGKVHNIKKADGPERIEQEWWLEEGKHRDYYLVEDEEGRRYWLFRLGHYEQQCNQWYLHGFFA